MVHRTRHVRPPADDHDQVSAAPPLRAHRARTTPLDTLFALALRVQAARAAPTSGRLACACCSIWPVMTAAERRAIRRLLERVLAASRAGLCVLCSSSNARKVRGAESKQWLMGHVKTGSKGRAAYRGSDQRERRSHRRSAVR